jgi:hypothetical protein
MIRPARSAGSVSIREANTPTSVASGPRCVVTIGRDLVCTFMVQSALGVNDFVPVIARSSDDGKCWGTERPIWPHLKQRFSIFGAISRSSDGDLYFFGTRTPIHAPGEPNWCEKTQGLKENELIWARSDSEGVAWSEPSLIPMFFPCAAEAPGALCVAQDGTWHACYSPYNTFDPQLAVPRNQVVLLSSADAGRSWRSTAMLRFDDPMATAAEAWVVELPDGRLLGTCWNLNQRDGGDFPNANAVSNDRGLTWSLTRSTGIIGQTTALAPLPDGGALFVYCNRRHVRNGIWLARVQPSENDFGIRYNEVVWQSPNCTSAAAHDAWTGFTFGEPSATLLDDGRVLVFCWCLENGVGNIQFVELDLQCLI